MFRALHVQPCKRNNHKPSFTVVDRDVYEEQSQYKWHLNSYGYVIRKEWNGVRTKTVFLHRVVGEVPKGMVTDHINGDRIDNRRSNLRACAQRQNACNSRRPKSNTSGYVGVSRTLSGKWRAFIKHDYQQLNFGRYETKEEAAYVYDQAARQLLGEFARFNLD